MQLSFSAAGEASVAMSICNVSSTCLQQKLLSLRAEETGHVAKVQATAEELVAPTDKPPGHGWSATEILQTQGNEHATQFFCCKCKLEAMRWRPFWTSDF